MGPSYGVRLVGPDPACSWRPVASLALAAGACRPCRRFFRRWAVFLEADGGTWIEPHQVVTLPDQVLHEGAFEVNQAADGDIEVRVVSSIRIRQTAARRAS